MTVHAYTRARVEVVEPADPVGDRPLLAPNTEHACQPAEALSAVPALGQLVLGESVAVTAPECAGLIEAPDGMGDSAAMSKQITVEDFNAIFTRFQTPLVNFVYRMVSNREEASDIVQDVFIKIYRALASGTTVAEGAFTSWAYRIAVNTTTDALRRRRRIIWVPMSAFAEDRGIGAGLPTDDNITATHQADFDHDHSNPLDGPFQAGNGGMFEDRVANIEIVQTVLSRMPPKYSRCLLLYEHEGFTCAEIAEILKLSPSAVKMRLMRAREHFIQLYEQLSTDEALTAGRPRVHKVAKHVRDVMQKHDFPVKSDRRKHIPGQAAIQGA